MENLKEIALKNNYRVSLEPEKLRTVRGYDFDLEFDFDELMKKLATSGAQASQFSRAIEIINNMIKERKKTTIFLGYTSNMVTSGNREIIRFLVKHRLVDVIVTTTGGIEEDFCKCFGDFYLGEFSDEGAKLHEQGINRAGNILIPNNRYIDLEKFTKPVLEELYQEQRSGEIASPSKLIKKLGEKINNEDSIYYWAQKNNIPVFCPGITDGAVGDNIHFFKYDREDFVMDVSSDIKKINELAVQAEQTGVLLLGAGIVKHHILNANMMRDGAKFSVYINTAHEFDGSDSGARPDEAISWGKILHDSQSVKVFGDATILFPLLVSQTFKKYVDSQK